ncbi:hypothetical protein [Psychrobacter sp. CMS30]|uniref:hypothetical protein n=1 Tax=Psychrobacter sp. CMS30 TaxID=2774126 RepID=UPI001918134F|nr:hypothetical protein [Psychrobacter sp. CMS30]
MLRNVETANSENNYKIILSEAANSQKRALLKTIVGIIVGIAIKQKQQTHINQGIQTILYFLPFRPNIIVKEKSQPLNPMVGFFLSRNLENNKITLNIR